MDLALIIVGILIGIVFLGIFTLIGYMVVRDLREL